MVTVDLDILLRWVEGLFIPLARILGFIAIAPVFGHRGITMTIKIMIGIVLAGVIIPAIPAAPRVDLVSAQGVLVIGQQMIVGLALGLMMQILFTAIEMAGQVSGLTMGFGFASFFDPSSGGTNTVTSTLFSILAMLVFLSLDGHLMMVTALVESFYTMPIDSGTSSINGMAVARFGAQIFIYGLQLALPIVASLLITNIALGVLTRAAPQLNIFGIGFPVTILAGLITIFALLPSMATPYRLIFEQGMRAVSATLK